MKSPPSPVSGLCQWPVREDTNGALTILHLVNGEANKFVIVLAVSLRNRAWVG